MVAQRCPYCGHIVEPIFVHSHYQCPVCGVNLIPCCEGETTQADYSGEEPPACPLPPEKDKTDETHTEEK